jgi:putative ABC transport system substrate-binding protein
VRRREFLTLIGSAVATFASHAQQPDRIRLIGVLMGFAESDPIAQSRLVAIRDVLTKLGWTEGRNLRIELRWGADDPDRMRTPSTTIKSGQG